MITEWIKRGVYGDLSREMQRAHGVIVRLYEKAGERDFYITSRSDGGNKHMHGSFHDIGMAEDYKKSLSGVITKAIIENELKREIGEGYQTIEDPDHFHTEYDPKEGA